MTTIANRPDIPDILAAKHARPGRLRTLAAPLRRAFDAGVRAPDQPWSIGVDVLVVAGLLALMCWETGEYGYTDVWEHLAAAVIAYTAGVVYAFRAFTD